MSEGVAENDFSNDRAELAVVGHDRRDDFVDNRFVGNVQFATKSVRQHVFAECPHEPLGIPQQSILETDHIVKRFFAKQLAAGINL